MRIISPLKIIGAIHFLGLFVVIESLNKLTNQTNGIFDFLSIPISYLVLVPYIIFGVFIFFLDSYLGKTSFKKSFWSNQIILSLLYLIPFLFILYPIFKKSSVFKIKNVVKTVVEVSENFNGEAAIIFGVENYPKLPKSKFFKQKIILPKDNFLITSSIKYKSKYGKVNVLKGVPLNSVTFGNAIYPCSVEGPNIAYTYISSISSDNKNLKLMLNAVCDSLKSGDLTLNELKFHPEFHIKERDNKDLNMYNYPLHIIPEFITDGKFTNIFLSFCGLKELPFECPNDSLISLDISDNNASSIASNLLNLQQLQTLYLDNNQIDSIPDCITLLPNLMSLDISNNPVTYLTPKITNLKNLRILTAYNTLLTEQQKSQLELFSPNCNFIWEDSKKRY